MRVTLQGYRDQLYKSTIDTGNKDYPLARIIKNPTDESIFDFEFNKFPFRLTCSALQGIIERKTIDIKNFKIKKNDLLMNFYELFVIEIGDNITSIGVGRVPTGMQNLFLFGASYYRKIAEKIATDKDYPLTSNELSKFIKQILDVDDFAYVESTSIMLQDMFKYIDTLKKGQDKGLKQLKTDIEKEILQIKSKEDYKPHETVEELNEIYNWGIEQVSGQKKDNIPTPPPSGANNGGTNIPTPPPPGANDKINIVQFQDNLADHLLKNFKIENSDTESKLLDNLAKLSFKNYDNMNEGDKKLLTQELLNIANDHQNHIKLKSTVTSKAAVVILAISAVVGLCVLGYLQKNNALSLIDKTLTTFNVKLEPKTIKYIGASLLAGTAAVGAGLTVIPAKSLVSEVNKLRNFTPTAINKLNSIDAKKIAEIVDKAKSRSI